MHEIIYILIIEKPRRIRLFGTCKRKQTFSILFHFYLPHSGLFYFTKKFLKGFKKSVQISKKSAMGTEKGFPPGHIEIRISIHQIPFS